MWLTETAMCFYAPKHQKMHCVVVYVCGRDVGCDEREILWGLKRLRECCIAGVRDVEGKRRYPCVGEDCGDERCD